MLPVSLGPEFGRMARKYPKELTVKEEDEDIVDVLNLASEPFATLVAAAHDSGLDPDVVKRMLRRIKAKYQPVVGELKTVKASELTGLLEDRAWRALEYLDDYQLAKASAKDLAIIAGIMLEKRQLLKGEPTHILSTTERLAVVDLVPLLVKEAEKRGFTIQNEHEMIDITPPAPERVARPRQPTNFKTYNQKKQAEAKIELGEL